MTKPSDTEVGRDAKVQPVLNHQQPALGSCQTYGDRSFSAHDVRSHAEEHDAEAVPVCLQSPDLSLHFATDLQRAEERWQYGSTRLHLRQQCSLAPHTRAPTTPYPMTNAIVPLNMFEDKPYGFQEMDYTSPESLSLQGSFEITSGQSSAVTPDSNASPSTMNDGFEGEISFQNGYHVEQHEQQLQLMPMTTIENQASDFTVQSATLNGTAPSGPTNQVNWAQFPAMNQQQFPYNPYPQAPFMHQYPYGHQTVTPFAPPHEANYGFGDGNGMNNYGLMQQTPYIPNGEYYPICPCHCPPSFPVNYRPPSWIPYHPINGIPAGPILRIPLPAPPVSQASNVPIPGDDNQHHQYTRIMQHAVPISMPQHRRQRFEKFVDDMYKGNPNWMYNRESQNKFIIEARNAGIQYKEIKERGKFQCEEVTLRGKHRALTKAREERPRKPKWSHKDDRLLRQAVNRYQEEAQFNRARKSLGGLSAHERFSKCVPWGKVVEYMMSYGATHRFGNSTCKKRYDSLCGVSNGKKARAQSSNRAQNESESESSEEESDE